VLTLADLCNPPVCPTQKVPAPVGLILRDSVAVEPGAHSSAADEPWMGAVLQNFMPKIATCLFKLGGLCKRSKKKRQGSMFGVLPIDVTSTLEH